MLKRVIFYIPVLLIMGAVQVFADPLLYDWLFNNNGDIYEASINNVDELPNYYNFNDFDWESGLGNITIAYDSAGDYSLAAFFDHEYSEGQNSYYNEYGEAVGSPETRQSWEIDEPGYVFGNIYDNAFWGLLDNSNAIPFEFEDDVSMALGWDFLLQENEMALVTLTIAELMPTGFYLSQNDPDGTIYFSSNLNVSSDTAPVPEPSSILLLSSGMTSLFALRKRMFHRKSLSCGQ